ncbi:MAG: folate family ECF transporter S component [Lachnospiraceae bacterium]|nr:folate family ECF transporter S component [Lachnospiraceae bacterium]MDD7078397.1 folate family ECF transporter S component [Lachnospiraceae bacterium]MDY3729563.1 folate family ECF transporter S component [Candidatus Choladocola sp.]
MQKNKKMTWDTRTLVFLGLLVAMHIVLVRLVVIDLGSYRITIGSVCTILAGLWFGPVAGGVSGLISDVLGCILKGYAINPLITVAAILWGVIPALMRPLMTGSKVKKTGMLWLSVVVTSILATLVFTTAGLVLLLGYNFYAIMPGRIVQWAIMTPIYCVLTSVLYYSPLTNMVLNATTRKEGRAANA